MFEFLSATDTIVAGLALIAAVLFGYCTNRMFRTACRDQVDIVELEFAWDFKAFSTMLAPLDDARIHSLVVGHYWDCGFAIAYSVAICSILQLLAGHLPPDAAAGVHAIAWFGLAAGAFDLVENLCLLKRIATLKRERRSGPVERPVDGLLRVAATAAAIKFALIGFCITGLAWGLLQGLAHCINRGWGS